MRNILIVEDNPDNLALLEAFLEDSYNLSSAMDGKTGLDMAINEKPDLILLDISLPEMDGTEVIKEIKGHQIIHNIPVVALTAHAMLGDKEEFLKQGFDAYMSKPIQDEDELIELIESLLK